MKYMNEVKKLNEIELKDSIILSKEESPKIGDIFISNHKDTIIRLESFDKLFKTSCYNFKTNSWENDSYRISESDLKNYYHKLLFFEDSMKDASEFMLNKKIETPQSSSEELTYSASKESLISINESLAIEKEKLFEKISCIKFIQEQKNRELKKLMDEMENTLSYYNDKMLKISRILTVLELYTGLNVEIVQIRKGLKSSSKFLDIRQLTLYMDEEVGNFKNGGYDYNNISDFDEWLTNPENMKKVIPEEKCIVFFKPRRKPKFYSSNYYENSILNKWNFQTYVLMRNGDNLYRIFSDDIYCEKLVFPEREKLKEIIKQASNDNYFAKKEFEDLNYRSLRIAALINGICQKTEIFESSYDMFRMEESNINIIYDGEKTLHSGHETFKEFKKRINEMMTEGSRIYFSGVSRVSSSRFIRYYSNDYVTPMAPEPGMYNLVLVDNKLCIRYKPNDFLERKNNISYIIYKDDDNLINYDQVTFKDIDYFCNDRLSKEDYLDMFPILLGLRERLLEDMNKEKEFVKMIMGETKAPENVVWEAVRWWKLKNKYKRSIWDDDEKATRMIKNKISKLLFDIY